MTRYAMTLLEILLAVTLLAVMTVCAAGWLRLSARMQARVEREGMLLREARLAQHCLARDLAGCVQPPDVRERSLHLRTIHCLPGERVAVRTVVWTCRDTDVIRESNDDTRPTRDRFNVSVSSPGFDQRQPGVLTLRGRELPSTGGLLETCWREWP